MRIAARCAYIAVVLFAAHLIISFIPALHGATFATAAGLALILAILALAQHGVVFPVAAMLPAPGWARIAAYVWLIGDTVSDLMQLAGSPTQRYLALRLIVNVLAALWFVAASWRAPMAMRIIGIFIGWDLVAYSLTGPFFPDASVILLPALILAPIWFALVGRQLSALASKAAGDAGAKPQPAAKPANPS